MKLLEMSLEEILLDTLEYYGEDEHRYCKKNSECTYSPATLGLELFSEGCAIGRLLTPEIALKFDNELGFTGIQDIVNHYIYALEFWDKEMANFLNSEIVFFSQLQMLHDRKLIKNGELDWEGDFILNELINEYSFDKSKFTKWL